MKQKLFLYLLVLTFVLSGCGARQPAQMEYIGADSAKAAAVEAAGFQSGQVTFSGVDMSTRQGLDYYHVEFTAEGQTYRYDIDALTGTIIEAQGPVAGAASPGTEETPLNGQPGQPVGGSFVTDADAGGPGPQQPPEQFPHETAGNAGESKTISVEEAKAIALAHAGLTADQVSFVKSGLDWDDGRETYDLEFYTSDHWEFDYDIDPYTGEVLSFDQDAEYYTPPASNNSGATITADEAKAKALAQVPGATVDDIWEFEVDYDDGRLEYEGKIYYNHMEYEFEIDGYSGAIRNWDVESIYD